jgi:hypothetical protein
VINLTAVSVGFRYSRSHQFDPKVAPNRPRRPAQCLQLHRGVAGIKQTVQSRKCNRVMPPDPRAIPPSMDRSFQMMR